MWRLFASSQLVKHEVSRFSTALPTYATGLAKSGIYEHHLRPSWKARSLAGRPSNTDAGSVSVNITRTNEKCFMSDQVVLITGALTGIGRAAAIIFAQEGAHIVVSGRRDKEGQALVAELQGLGAEAIFVRTDVRRMRKCATL